MLLNCNSSLRVPPLLPYDLSNIRVVLLLKSGSPNIMDMLVCSVAYVQKGYIVSDLVDIWN